MRAVEPLLGILAAATVTLVALAALLTAVLMGRGPLSGRFQGNRRPVDHGSTEGVGEVAKPPPLAGVPIEPTVRLVARERRPAARPDALARGGTRPADEELDDVLRGNFAADTYNRMVRVVAWSFILIALLIVSVGRVWQPAEPQIVATLIVAGIFVVVVHELSRPTRLRTARLVIEGSAAIVFLTTLVLLTGNSSSPFFFLYPLLVGGVALVATPAIIVILAVETVAAYAVAAFSGPMDPVSSRDALARIAINLTALVLLAYSGLVVARVQRRTKEAAIRLSTIDSLTDLFNRAYFFNAIDHEIQRGRRFGRGFCLLMMDLDGLKPINDRYGHYQGDAILRGVAQLIRTGLRRVDVAARYGGDEFVALLPETDPSGAYVVAEKIRRMASEFVVDAGGDRITTSLSIGVVSYPDDGQTADELMIAADEAMYSSKRLGKNRVVGYAEVGEPTQPSRLSHRTRVSTTDPGPRPHEEDGWHPDRSGHR